MKIRQRKLLVFLMIFFLITTLQILTIFFAPSSWVQFGKVSTILQVVNGIMFISFTVIKDYIKSKYYRKELDDTNIE